MSALKFEKRLETPPLVRFGIPLLSLLLALAAGGLLLAAVGTNPFTAYGAMIDGAFGGRYELTETLVRATPLILTGLSVGDRVSVGGIERVKDGAAVRIEGDKSATKETAP